MGCANCGNETDESERFCRKCGTDLQKAPLEPSRQNLPEAKTLRQDLLQTTTKDPDELVGNGIGSMFVGDGFLIVGVILSATHSAISSLLWLLLLIPSFFFYGKGVTDILYARQIRRRLKQNELTAASPNVELPARASVRDVFKKQASSEPSGQLRSAPSVTERTTRNLN